MAIRIDLLPKYVGLKKWLKRSALASVVLIAGTAGILYVLYFQGEQKLKVAEENLLVVDEIAKKTEATEQQLTTAQADAAPLASTVGFLVDASRSGAERAHLIDLVRRYIYEDAVVGAIDLSDGQTVKMNATMKTPDDYARFLLNLRRASAPEGGSLFADRPGASGVPGFPHNTGATTTSAPGQTTGTGAPGTPGASGTTTPVSTNEPRLIVFPLSIAAEGKLKYPLTVPVEPGGPSGGAAGAAAPPGGAPGAPPGAPPTTP